MPKLNEKCLAVVGLGYVGLPLALELGKFFETIGFDVDKKRVDSLVQGKDENGEFTETDLSAPNCLIFSSDERFLSQANVFFIAVPTPVDTELQPDLTLLKRACETVGRYITNGDIVVVESTVYPGATEEVCVPILEKVSGQKYNSDFFVGYSPERINPGDAQHSLKNVSKIVSGSNENTSQILKSIYSNIVGAQIFVASNIRTAEAAKIIENIQRDVNIALVNELSGVFRNLGIDTTEVIEAASTKWNFAPYVPGLVGGHCIGVDPYYLTFKAEQMGMNPQLILAGRETNNNMPDVIFRELRSILLRKFNSIQSFKILICGVTFKENCADLRNSRVEDLIGLFESSGSDVTISDPLLQFEQVEIGKIVRRNYQLCEIDENKYHCVIVAVSHSEFRQLGAGPFRNKLLDGGILADIKSIFDRHEADYRL